MKVYIATDSCGTMVYSSKPKWRKYFELFSGECLFDIPQLLPQDFKQEVGECVEAEITMTIKPLKESKPSKGVTTTKV